MHVAAQERSRFLTVVVMYFSIVCELRCVAASAGVTRQAGRLGKASRRKAHQTRSSPKSESAIASSGISENTRSCSRAHASPAKSGVCISTQPAVVATQLGCVCRTRSQAWYVPCTSARIAGCTTVARVARRMPATWPSGKTAGCTAMSQSKTQTARSPRVRAGVSTCFQKSVFIPGTPVPPTREWLPARPATSAAAPPLGPGAASKRLTSISSCGYVSQSATSAPTSGASVASSEWIDVAPSHSTAGRAPSAPTADGIACQSWQSWGARRRGRRVTTLRL